MQRDSKERQKLTAQIKNAREHFREGFFQDMPVLGEWDVEWREMPSCAPAVVP